MIDRIDLRTPMTNGANAYALGVEVQPQLRPVPTTLEQEAALKHPKITPIRPLGASLQEVKTEALMPRSEAPDPIVLQRLTKTPIAKWLDYRPDPATRTYEIGKPMEMLCVPASDEDAAKVRNRSNANKTEVVSTTEAISVNDALRNSFAFLSMYSKAAATAENPNPEVAALTEGYTWDQQSRGIENVGVQTLEAIAGTHDVVWVRVGGEKIYGFFRGKKDLKEMAEKSVSAPREAYNIHLPHLADAQGQIQDARVEDVLNPKKGSARRWIDVQEGKRSGMERALGEEGDSTLSFVFGLEQIEEDGKLKHQGIGLNYKPIKMETLALGAPELALGDTTTTDALLAMDEFLSGSDIEDRFVVSFVWSKDTPCCNDAVNSGDNSLVTTNKFEMSAVQTFASARLSGQEVGTLSYPNGEKYHSSNYCSSCNNKKDGEGKCGSCSFGGSKA